jgi:hypothetical protein
MIDAQVDARVSRPNLDVDVMYGIIEEVLIVTPSGGD